jgi:hypothetical protein
VEGEVGSEFGDVKYYVYRGRDYVGKILTEEPEGGLVFMAALYFAFSLTDLEEIFKFMKAH